MNNNKQERLIAAISYVEMNKPPQHVLDRFDGVLSNWQAQFPLYCAESDVISAITPLIYTQAIAFDFDEQPSGGFSERYCFEDPLVALEQLIEWHKRGYNDMRPCGWVAVRKISSAQRLKESFEKYYKAGYATELLPYADKFNDGVLLHGSIIEHIDQISEKLGYDTNTVKHLASYLKITGQVY